MPKTPRTKLINPAGAEAVYEAFKFSQAVVAGDQVQVSGQVGVRLEDMHISDDIRDQARQAFSNLEGVLKEAGSSMPNIMALTMYYTDIADVSAVSEVISEVFGDRYPAQTAVQVVSLVMPQLRLEIQAAAVLDG